MAVVNKGHFRPGVSGNPGGRRKNTARAALRAALDQPVPGKGGLKVRDEWARSLVASAIDNDQRLDILKFLEGSSPPPGDGEDAEGFAGLIEELRERVRLTHPEWPEDEALRMLVAGRPGIVIPGTRQAEFWGARFSIPALDPDGEARGSAVDDLIGSAAPLSPTQRAVLIGLRDGLIDHAEADRILRDGTPQQEAADDADTD